MKFLLLLYILAILLLTTLPINSAGELNDIHILKFRGDYFFHALMFMPWMFFRGAIVNSKWKWLVLGILFAAGSEIIQYILPYRAYNINDLMANSLGVVISFALWFIWVKIRR